MTAQILLMLSEQRSDWLVKTSVTAILKALQSVVSPWGMGNGECYGESHNNGAEDAKQLRTNGQYYY